jgi:hypothetical protein
MGSGASKANVQNNMTEISDVDVMLTTLFKEVIAKYSEIIDASDAQYFVQLTEAYKNKSSIPNRPFVDIAEVFKKSCKDDVIAVFERKLKRFPIWAIRNQGIFGGLFSSSLNPILMEYNQKDINAIKKSELCASLAKLCVNVLYLIESSVNNLMKCRSGLINVVVRVDKSFNGINNIPSGAVADAKKNKEWFKKVIELQKIYKKHVIRNNKLFVKLNNIQYIDAIVVDKFVKMMEKEQLELILLPEQCDFLVDQINRIPTIDNETFEICKQLNIPDINCSKNTIADTRAKNKIRISRDEVVYTTDV